MAVQKDHDLTNNLLLSPGGSDPARTHGADAIDLAQPGTNPLDLREEIGAALEATGVDHHIELYLFRPGYEAKGVEPLVTAVTEAHRAVVGGDPPAVSGPTASMWRDSNVFA